MNVQRDHNSLNCLFFELNKPEYSFFPYEKEILLFDGLKLDVIDVTEERH